MIGGEVSNIDGTLTSKVGQADLRHQHGRQRRMAGQCVCGAAAAIRQI